MRLAVLLTLLGLCLQEVRFDWDSFRDRSRAARSAEDVAALEKELPAALDGPCRDQARDEVLGAWIRLRRPAEAVRVVEGIRAQQQKSAGGAWVTDWTAELESTYCRVLEAAGRTDDAIASAERLRALATSPEFLSMTDDGPSWPQVAHRHLARLHEKKGDLEKALAWYRAWQGSSAWPNIRDGELRSRDGSIARCLWRLGRTDEALDAAITGAARPGHFMPDDEPAVWAVEIALRSGRLADLRKRIDAEKDDLARARLDRSADIAEAFVAKDADAILNAVEVRPAAPQIARIPFPVEIEFAAKLLRQLGTIGIDTLSARIRMGDMHAVSVARTARVTECLPALRELRKTEGLTELQVLQLDAVLGELEPPPPPGK